MPLHLGFETYDKHYYSILGILNSGLEETKLSEENVKNLFTWGKNGTTRNLKNINIRTGSLITEQDIDLPYDLNRFNTIQ